MPEISLKKFSVINYIIAALIIAAALLLTRNIINFSFLKKEPGPAVTDKIIRVDGPSMKKNLMYYSPILEKNPFGPPLTFYPARVSETYTGQPGKEYGPVSNLILLGTVAGPHERGYAVFIDKSGAAGSGEELFTYGEDVFNYGKLRKINYASVEIERDSVVYTVRIPFDDTGPVADTAEQAPEQADTDRETRSSRRSFAKRIDEKTYVLDSRKVQQSLENPQQLLTEARLLPVIKDGKQEGFILSEVVPEGMYHSLGLRNGDTLLKINGLEISNPEVAIQAMSALKGMNSIELDIIRNGARMSMSYEIK